MVASKVSSAAPEAALPSPTIATPKATVPRPASCQPPAGVTLASAPSSEQPGAPPPPVLPRLLLAEPVLSEVPQSPPDSSPSLRALEISRAAASSEEPEPTEEEAELSDELGADHTPSGILVDRVAIARPRARAQRALPLASALTVAVLGAGLWWQVSGIRTPASTGAAASTPGPAGAEPAAQPRTPAPEPEPVSKSEPVSEPGPALDAARPEVPDRVDDSPPAPAYDVQRLDLALRWARTNAERCHRGGRAVGTAQLSITFSPEGKVTVFELTGEPIASAPVATCVTTYFRSMLIPAFDGEAFTIHETLTLR